MAKKLEGEDRKSRAIMIVLLVFIIVILSLLLLGGKKDYVELWFDHVELGNNTQIEHEDIQNNQSTKNKLNNTGCNETDNGFDPLLAGSAQGDNGFFTDKCDSQGNLIEYYCMDMAASTSGSYLQDAEQIAITQDSNVRFKVMDCGGECSLGRCFSHCPGIGDVLDVKENIGGNVSFVNENRNEGYICSLIYDNPNDSYSCIEDLKNSQKVTISTLGLKDFFCLSKKIGNIGINDKGFKEIEECAYECELG